MSEGTSIALYCIVMAVAVVLIVYLGTLHLPKMRAKKSFLLQQRVAEIVEHLHDLNAPYEIIYIIDQEGKVVAEETQYDPDRVALKEEQVVFMQTNPGCISIHNHRTNTPPSIDDLMEAAERCESCLIVVTPKYKYIITPSLTGWKSIEDLEAAVQKHSDKLRVINITGLTFTPADDGGWLLHTNYEIESTEGSLEAIVRELGYGYVRREIV